VNMEARPLSQQVKLLRAQHDTIRHVASPRAAITLICHSQGCVTAALADLPNIARTIFLTPPDNLDPAPLLARWGQRAGSRIDTQGLSHLVRADGSITRVPASVWQQMQKISPSLQQHFSLLASKTQLHVITAQQDDVLGATDFSFLAGAAQISSLAGDHNFSGPARQPLLAALRAIL
jgi:hypothetical protein